MSMKPSSNYLESNVSITTLLSHLKSVFAEKKPAQLFSDKIIASEADRKEAWDGVIQPKLIVPLQNPEDLLNSAFLAQQTSLFGMTNEQRHQAEREFQRPDVTDKVRQNEKLFSSQCQGDYYSMLSLLTRTNPNGKVASNAKLIFEESNPRDFENSIKSAAVTSNAQQPKLMKQTS